VREREETEMARFYADIQGSRGEATRMGTAASGIQAHPRGWNLGVQVDGGTRDEEDNLGLDEFDITISRGSNGYGNRIAYLGRVYEEEDGTVTVRLGSAFGEGTFRFDKAGNAITDEEDSR
jgi:hypothetical protein